MAVVEKSPSKFYVCEKKMTGPTDIVNKRVSVCAYLNTEQSQQFDTIRTYFEGTDGIKRSRNTTFQEMVTIFYNNIIKHQEEKS